MNCEHVITNLSRFYDGEMSEEEACLCKEHIAKCESCRGELESFQSISNVIRSCEAEPRSSNSWSKLSARLEHLDQTAHDTGTIGPVRVANSPWLEIPWVGLLVALAASVLVIMGAPSDLGQSTSEIAVDLSSVVDRYASEPSKALAQLNKQFAGITVGLAEAKELLGYEPIKPTGLQGDVQIVSTSVLRLPVCICTAGKCTCGPAGCNCSAILCKRNDGSELLVLEHCESKKVELTKSPARVLANAKQPTNLYGDRDRLIASWLANDHRLTAIGLRSAREAHGISVVP